MGDVGAAFESSYPGSQTLRKGVGVDEAHISNPSVAWRVGRVCEGACKCDLGGHGVFNGSHLPNE